MKASRVVLWSVLSFIAGCLGHKFYTDYQFEKKRGELESYYQGVFHRGDDFEKMSGPQKEGVIWRYDEQAHSYDAILPPDITRRLRLRIKVDDGKKIQEVSVVTLIQI